MTGRFESSGAECTEQIAKRFAESIEKDAVIAMFGGLGMGKTAFVRGLAEGLGISPDTVYSPTFAIVNEYPGSPTLYHFDMYRVSSWEDLYSTGFFDYQGSGVIAIEWSENIENALPDDRYEIRIEKGEKDDDRIITVSRFVGGIIQ